MATGHTLVYGADTISATSTAGDTRQEISFRPEEANICINSGGNATLGVGSDVLALKAPTVELTAKDPQAVDVNATPFKNNDLGTWTKLEGHIDAEANMYSVADNEPNWQTFTSVFTFAKTHTLSKTQKLVLSYTLDNRGTGNSIVTIGLVGTTRAIVTGHGTYTEPADRIEIGTTTSIIGTGDPTVWGYKFTPNGNDTSVIEVTGGYALNGGVPAGQASTITCTIYNNGTRWFGLVSSSAVPNSSIDYDLGTDDIDLQMLSLTFDGGKNSTGTPDHETPTVSNLSVAITDAVSTALTLDSASATTTLSGTEAVVVEAKKSTLISSCDQMALRNNGFYLCGTSTSTSFYNYRQLNITSERGLLKLESKNDKIDLNARVIDTMLGGMICSNLSLGKDIVISSKAFISSGPAGYAGNVNISGNCGVSLKSRKKITLCGSSVVNNAPFDAASLSVGSHEVPTVSIVHCLIAQGGGGGNTNNPLENNIIDIHGNCSVNITSGGNTYSRSANRTCFESLQFAVTAGTCVNIFSSQNINLCSSGGTRLYSGANLCLNAASNVNVLSGANLCLNAASNVKVLSGANLCLNAASNVNVLASTIHMTDTVSQGTVDLTSGALTMNGLRLVNNAPYSEADKNNTTSHLIPTLSVIHELVNIRPDSVPDHLIGSDITIDGSNTVTATAGSSTRLNMATSSASLTSARICMTAPAGTSNAHILIEGNGNDETSEDAGYISVAAKGAVNVTGKNAYITPDCSLTLSGNGMTITTSSLFVNSASVNFLCASARVTTKGLSVRSNNYSLSSEGYITLYRGLTGTTESITLNQCGLFISANPVLIEANRSGASVRVCNGSVNVYATNQVVLGVNDTIFVNASACISTTTRNFGVSSSEATISGSQSITLKTGCDSSISKRILLCQSAMSLSAPSIILSNIEEGTGRTTVPYLSLNSTRASFNSTEVRFDSTEVRFDSTRIVAQLGCGLSIINWCPNNAALHLNPGIINWQAADLGTKQLDLNTVDARAGQYMLLNYTCPAGITDKNLTPNTLVLVPWDKISAETAFVLPCENNQIAGASGRVLYIPDPSNPTDTAPLTNLFDQSDASTVLAAGALDVTLTATQAALFKWELIPTSQGATPRMLVTQEAVVDKSKFTDYGS